MGDAELEAARQTLAVERDRQKYWFDRNMQPPPPSDQDSVLRAAKIVKTAQERQAAPSISADSIDELLGARPVAPATPPETRTLSPDEPTEPESEQTERDELPEPYEVDLGGTVTLNSAGDIVAVDFRTAEISDARLTNTPCRAATGRMVA